MVALARTIFSDTNANPVELLKYTSAAELEDRFLAGLVPSVYAHTRHDNRPCSAEDAQRYLGFLASHLQRLGTYDLAWWQLVTALPRTAIGLFCGLLITLIAWLGTGMIGAWGTWDGNDARTAWLAASAVAAVACGAAGGTIIGIGLLEHPLPARMQLRIASRLGQVARNFALGLRSWRTLIWFLVWAGSGMLFGLAASRLLGSESGIAAGLAAGLLAGTGAWLLIATVRALSVPVEPTEIISPTELLDTNRATALRQGLIVGVGGATVLWLTIRLAFETTFGLPFGTVFPSALWLLGWLIAAGSGVLLWILFVTVWGPWLIARTWLSLTHRLPWSIMIFLADAHRRGVLRQAGGVYQFRHARLQNHLAHRNILTPSR